MKRNGFTLIELLAVIVILAIIAVIATPIIVGLIEDARKESFERSVEMILSATDLDFGMQESLDNYIYIITDGEISNIDVPVKNTTGFNGTIKYDENGNSRYSINNGKLCMVKDSSGNVTTTDYVEGECELIEYTDESCFTYIEIDGGIEITDYSDSCPRDVVIPETIDGKTVVSIGSYAFYADYDSESRSYINQLTSIKLPTSLIEIGDSAFAFNQISGDLNLSNFTNLTKIGKNAFSYNQLSSAVLPNGIEFGNCVFGVNLETFVWKIGDTTFDRDDYCMPE